MRLNKKALSAAITMSLVLGVYGVAGATDNYLYGSTNASSAVDGVTRNSTTTGVNKTTGAMENVSDATTTSAKYTVNSGTWYRVYGGFSKDSTVSNNEVTISGGTINDYVSGGCGYTGANSNTLNISGGTINCTVYGGYSYNGTASSNTVTIKGGTITGSVAGGSGSNNASSNTVTISGTGTEIKGNVSGGSGSNNTVTIKGGTITGYDVSGGSGSNNTVTIEGGTINGYVLGGAINSGTVGNNTINLGTANGTGNATINGDVYINANYGLFGVTGSAGGGTLNVYSVGNKINAYSSGTTSYNGDLYADQVGSSDSASVNFYIPKTAVNGDTMLTVAGKAYLTGATINTDMTNYQGGTITLLSTGTDTNWDSVSTWNIVDAEGTHVGKEIVKVMDVSIKNMNSVQATKVGYNTSDAQKLTFGATAYQLAGVSDITGAVTLGANLDAQGKTLNFKIPASTVDTMLSVTGAADISGATINTVTSNYKPGKTITLLSATGITKDENTKYQINGTTATLDTPLDNVAVNIDGMTNVIIKYAKYTLDNDSKTLSFGTNDTTYYVGTSSGDASDITAAVTLNSDLDASHRTLNFQVPADAGDTMLSVTGPADLAGATINTVTSNYSGKTITLLGATGITKDTNTKYLIDGEDVASKEFAATVTNMTNVNATVAYTTDDKKITFGATGYKLAGASDVTGAVALDAKLDANKQTLNFKIPASASGTMLSVTGTADVKGATINTDTKNYTGDTITLLSTTGITKDDNTQYQINGTEATSADIAATVTNMSNVKATVAYDTTSDPNKITFGATGYKLAGASDVIGTADLDKNLDADKQTLNFKIPADVGDTMLSVSGTADITGATINTDTTNYSGETITLLSTTGGITTDAATTYQINNEDAKSIDIATDVTDMTNVGIKAGYITSETNKLQFGSLGEYSLMGTAAVTGDVTLDKALDLKGQTINMQQAATETAKYSTLNVAKLTGTGNLAIDADLSGTGNNDKINITGSDSSATVNVNSILVRNAGTETDWAKTLSVITGNTTGVTLTATDVSVVVSSTEDYDFTFTVGDAGKLNVVREDSVKTVGQFISGKKPASSGTGTVDVKATSFTLTKAGELESNVTTATNSKRTTKDYTLGMNKGVTLTGTATNAGIVVAEGFSLDVNGQEISEGETYAKITKMGTALTNNAGGTLTVERVILTDNTTDILNNGTATLTDVQADTVANNGALTIAAGDNAAQISGAGTLNFGNGTNTVTITNNGVVTQKDVVIAAKATLVNKQALTASNGVQVDGVLDNNSTITGKLTNDGTVYNRNAASIKGNVTNTGYVNNYGLVNGNVTNSGTWIDYANSSVVGTMTNNGILESQGQGTASLDSVAGTGTLAVKEGTTTVTNGFEQTGVNVAKEAKLVLSGRVAVDGDVANNGSLTLQDIVGKSNKITGQLTNAGTFNAAGELALSSVSGAGTTNVTAGMTTVSGDFAQNNVTVTEGATLVLNGGNFAVTGSVTNDGTYQQGGGSFIVNGDVNNTGSLTLRGLTGTNNQIGGQLTNDGTFNVYGTMALGSVSGAGTTNVAQGTTTVTGEFTQNSANVDEGAKLILQGSSFTVNGNVANNGTLESQGTGSLGSVTGEGMLAVTKGTTTVDSDFTQKGLTVASGASFVQNGGSFVVDGDVVVNGADDKKGTVTLNNMGGEVVQDIANAKNRITGKLTNNGTFTLSNTVLYAGGLEGNAVVAQDNTSALYITAGKLEVNELAINTAIAADSFADSSVGKLKDATMVIANAGSTPLAIANNNDYAFVKESEIVQSGENAKVLLGEGAIVGDTTFAYDAAGNRTIHENANRHNMSVDGSLADSVSFGRMEMNDIRKRLGDIRINNAKNGLWARYENGKNEGSGLDQNFNKFQIGGDTAQSDTWRLGGAISYTKGSSSYDVGSTDTRTMSGAVYGVMTGKKGEYLDIIARVGVDKHDINAQLTKGDLNNVSYAVSAEVGKTYDFAKNYFVEPQLELTFTRTNGDDFNYDGRNYKMEDSNSFVSRLGFALGYKAPDNRGCIYTRLGWLHEFAGEKNLVVSNDILARTSTTAASKNWIEWAIGGQISTSKSTYFYADIEKTFNADINEKYRLNVGMRYSF